MADLNAPFVTQLISEGPIQLLWKATMISNHLFKYMWQDLEVVIYVHCIQTEAR